MVQSKHSQLRRLTQNVRRSASNMLPRLPNAFDQKWFIGSRVGNELDAIQRHGIDELVYFKDAAPILPGEAAQIHKDNISITNQSIKHHPPGVVVTEEFINSEAAVMIRARVHLCQLPIERRRVNDETAAQFAAEKIEEFMRLQVFRCQIGSRNQLHAAGISPIGCQPTEQTPAALAESKDAQHQQLAVVGR